MKKKDQPSSSEPEAEANGAEVAEQAGASPEVEAPPDQPAGGAAATEATIAEKLAEAQERHLRLAADFDNYRKRVIRDLQEARIAARTDAMASVLNVFDHFRLAMAAAETNADPQVLHDGMNMILAEFEKALEEAGIGVIEAAGRPFDPRWHEASAREFSATVPENHVVRQWRCGYRLGDRLLRPAAVVVSAGPAPETVPAEAGKAADEPPAEAGGQGA